MVDEAVTKLYEGRWKMKKKSKFSEYERNCILEGFFPKTHKKLRVLDVACGDGAVSAFLHQQGYKVWGIDISSTAIRSVKSLGIGHFRQGNVKGRLPYASDSFDIVFLGDILEHLFDPQDLLEEARRVLRKKGRVILSCPNMGFWMYRWHYFKTGEIPLTEGHETTCWQTGHIRFYTLSSIKSLLRYSGFGLTRVAGVNKSTIYTLVSRLFPSLFASIIVIEGKVN